MFHFGCLTGFIIMISMWLSVIVMLAAFVNGGRNGECCPKGEIANLPKQQLQWLFLKHILCCGYSAQTEI